MRQLSNFPEEFRNRDKSLAVLLRLATLSVAKLAPFAQYLLYESRHARTQFAICMISDVGMHYNKSISWTAIKLLELHGSFFMACNVFNKDELLLFLFSK